MNYDAIWEKTFEALKTYGETYGDFNIPKDYIVNGKKLYGWLQSQRTAYREGRLTPYRHEKLKSIGVEMKPRSLLWGKSFERTVNTIKNGGTEEERKWAREWLRNQRVAYKNGELSQERLDALRHEGFDMEGINEWDRRFNIVKEWYDEHKNLEVPDICVEGKNLRDWIAGQKIRAGHLSEEHQEKLKSIGISPKKKRWALEEELGLEISTTDQMKGLEHALTLITDRERDVIKMYYMENKTLRDCAKKHSVTHERIRQVKAKALRKLRHPSRFKFIERGYEAQLKYIRIKEAEEKEKERKLAERKMQTNDIPIEALGLTSRALNCMYGEGITTVSQFLDIAMCGKSLAEIKGLGYQTQREIREKAIEVVSNGMLCICFPDFTYGDPIESMGFSVRTFNCLQRAKIKTVGDLMKLLNEDRGAIRKMRCAGVKTEKEIWSMAREEVLDVPACWRNNVK